MNEASRIRESESLSASLFDEDEEMDVGADALRSDRRSTELEILRNYAGAVGNENFRDVMEHGRRTAVTAVAMATAMGLPEQELDTLQTAAFTHDVGKILVPVSIQQKPGPLTLLEYSSIRNHTWFGKILLESISSKDDDTYPVRKIRAQVALLHHERWDGTGYPMHLKGSAIPLLAQITSVADVFDALLSERTYKAAWTRDRVLATIAAERGQQFSPECVDALLQVESNLL